MTTSVHTSEDFLLSYKFIFPSDNVYISITNISREQFDLKTKTNNKPIGLTVTEITKT